MGKVNALQVVWAGLELGRSKACGTNVLTENVIAEPGIKMPEP